MRGRAASRGAPAVAALRLPNFRRYVVAQLASSAGMWCQRVAELWLLLELTGTGLSLGLGAALRTAPAIFFATPAGALADRIDRRRLLTATQASRGVVGVVFAAVVAGSPPRLGVVYALILALGIVAAIDAPVRRSFVRDVVGPDDLRAAAGLHTATISVGRMIGPAVAGVAIAQWGVAAAFLASAATATVAVMSVQAIRPRRTPAATEPVVGDADADDVVVVPTGDRSAAAAAGGGERPTELRIRETLVLLAVFSMFAWNLDVILPVLADEVLGRGPIAFSGLVICLSAGSFLGSVGSTALSGAGVRRRSLVAPLLLVGIGLPAVAASASLPAVAGTLVLVGAVGGVFLSSANAAVQLAADPATQGRVIAVYSIVFTGSRAFGAPLLGWSIDRIGPRPSLVVLGLVTAGVGALAAAGLRRFGGGNDGQVVRSAAVGES